LPLSGSIENANNRRVSCFALNFGGYDRYGLKGLDNISCDVDIGCQGDKLFIINVRSAIIVIYFWFGILFDV
jgi:hypothetical protein